MSKVAQWITVNPLKRTRIPHTGWPSPAFEVAKEGPKHESNIVCAKINTPQFSNKVFLEANGGRVAVVWVFRLRNYVEISSNPEIVHTGNQGDDRNKLQVCASESLCNGSLM